MLFPCNMDGSESVPECFLFEAEEARVGDALKTGIAIDLDEWLEVQGQQEVGVIQYERDCTWSVHGEQGPPHP